MDFKSAVKKRSIGSSLSLLAFGSWLLALGFWLLAFGSWLFLSISAKIFPLIF
jgi:hypothetical protein